MGNGVIKIVTSMMMLTIPAIWAPRTDKLHFLGLSHTALTGYGRHGTRNEMNRIVK